MPISFSSKKFLVSALAVLCSGLTTLTPEATAKGIQRLEDLPYLDKDRTEALDLYLPDKETAPGLRPGVVWIHGGGWQGGTKRDSREVAVSTSLAEAGYVVVSPDYALATMERPTWPLALLDCKNAVRFLRANAEKYQIDPERIAVMGGSAGGHLALMVAFTMDDTALAPATPYPNVSDKVGAVADFYGITNLLTRQRVEKDGTPTGTLHPGSSRKFTGKSLPEGKELWEAASPVLRVKAGLPPVFITHGKRDATVDYLQATELAAALDKAGVPHELVLLEEAGHTYTLTHWAKKPLEKDLRPLLLKFLKEHLR